jgi:FtsZ-binding cell division protein ZapB
MFTVHVKSQKFGDIVTSIFPFASPDGKIEFLKLKAILRIMEQKLMPEYCSGVEFNDILTDMSKVENAMLELEAQKREFYLAKREHDRNVQLLEDKLRSADHVKIQAENDRLKTLTQQLRDEVDSSRSDATLRSDNNRLKSEISSLQEELRMARTAAAIRTGMLPTRAPIVSTNDIGNALAQGQWSTTPTPPTVIAPAAPAQRPASAPTPAGNALEID